MRLCSLQECMCIQKQKHGCGRNKTQQPETVKYYSDSALSIGIHIDRAKIGIHIDQL